MKGFKKLSSIAMLLCAFVYPPSLAEAKDISLNNVRNEQSAAPEANLVGDKTGELLIAQWRPRRYENNRRRQIIRRRERLGGDENIRRRPFERYENNRRRSFERYENNRRRSFERYQNNRRRY
ncbi:MAG: hypothetical protein V7K27_16685 [Nostoc sp.]|uniref:hypothetical protein n=1 Tax=Nostoc sp. TaxID=1180 RepID=UPI002FF60FD5